MENEIVACGGQDHQTDRNYIHWDICTKCNYDCSYCYAKREYKELWQKEANITDIDTILQSIKLSSLPVFLGLLGGEPTISKYLNYILDNLTLGGFFEHSRNRLYIVSNGSKSTLKFIKNLKDSSEYNNKFFWLLSWHQEEALKEHKDIKLAQESFKKCALLLKNLGYKVKINLMLDKDNLDLNLTKYFLELEKQGIILHWHFTYQNEHKLDEYSEEVFKEVVKLQQTKYSKKEFVIKTSKGNKEVSDAWLLDTNHNRNNFKGWDCWLNNYEIDFKGNVTKFCTKERTSLIDDVLFFRKIKKTVPIKCMYNKCTCDGLLKIQKQKL